MNPCRPLAALFLLLIIGAGLAWLVSGSSNQPTQPGWTAGWRSLPSFELPRRAPAAVIHNGYLYLIGGMDGRGDYVRPVEFAPILADGGLGPWRRTSPLQEGRFYNAAMAHGRFLYTLGGGSGPPGEHNYPVASVERAMIRDDGSLGPWQTVSRMQSPRRGLKTVLQGNTLYAIGGYDGRFLKSTEQVSIGSDGELGPWRMAAHESIIDRYIHAATATDGVIYLLGGHMRNPGAPSYRDVEAARIGSDRHLGPWQLEAYGLQSPRLVAEAFTLGRHLYIAGGHNGNDRLSSVEVATIDGSGTIGPWRFTTPLPEARSAYAAASDGRHVYLLGGGGADQPLDSVIMAAANSRGELGQQRPIAD